MVSETEWTATRAGSWPEADGERRQAGAGEKSMGGRRKSLEVLNTDKRIQGNRPFFLGFSLARLG
jgi:hypothetical protein